LVILYMLAVFAFVANVYRRHRTKFNVLLVLESTIAVVIFLFKLIVYLLPAESRVCDFSSSQQSCFTWVGPLVYTDQLGTLSRNSSHEMYHSSLVPSPVQGVSDQANLCCLERFGKQNRCGYRCLAVCVCHVHVHCSWC
jgi:hypothetical protein